MSIIAQTSEALLLKIRQLCGSTLREIAEHSGQWDDSSIRLVVRNPPAVYVAWLGQTLGRHRFETQARWAIFVVANVLNGQRQQSVGIYQIVEQLTAGLHKTHIEPSGMFELQSVQNLWSETQSGMGVAVYAMYFNAEQPLPNAIADNALADFIHYQHQPLAQSNAQQDNSPIHLILPTEQESQ